MATKGMTVRPGQEGRREPCAHWSAGLWGEVDSLSLEDAPSPVPKAGQVLIEVKATPVNFADTLMVRGQYQTRPDFPFSPGLETAGVIAGCGAGVAHLAPGTG